MNYINEHSYQNMCSKFAPPARMISDRRALVSRSIDNILLKVKPSLHQALWQVVDVLNRFIHALLYNTPN